MPFDIVRNDITNMQVDAIVNAASRLPRVGAGVDSAIHKKAGPSLLAARKEIGYIRPGTAAITPSFGLGAEYVIHAATPTWIDGAHGEAEALRSAYDMSLALAAERGCDSIAFPLLASGNHGFPKQKALQVAVAAFSEFLMENEMQIYLVVFGKESLRLSEKLVHNVACYIDENYVDAYEQTLRPRYQMSRNLEMSDVCMASMPCEESSLSLDEYIKNKDAGFTETLLSLIKKKGLKNATVYKRANISKQHFSKLINDPNAKPSKQTAIALSLALELNLDATRDLIGRAGYALTNSSTFDLIIRYFIEHGQFNVIEINIALYEFDQSLLGA
ncbi:MAG: macro domain-containing protein [Oscillospiraceae bacterium]|nr:macro domain-containing protein [Oscillospiraceae bacterium]